MGTANAQVAGFRFISLALAGGVASAFVDIGTLVAQQDFGGGITICIYRSNVFGHYLQIFVTLSKDWEFDPSTKYVLDESKGNFYVYPKFIDDVEIPR